MRVYRVRVSYTGKASHAAAFPWNGVNALDAAVLAYNNISVMRQQCKPDWRIHGEPAYIDRPVLGCARHRVIVHISAILDVCVKQVVLLAWWYSFTNGNLYLDVKFYFL